MPMFGRRAGGHSDPIRGTRGQQAPVSGGRAVGFTRTVGGAAEGSFTTTTVTFPKTADPRDVTVAVSAGSVLVQVQGAGKEFIAATATVNAPANIDLSALPDSATVDVQTQGLLANQVISGTVGYD